MECYLGTCCELPLTWCADAGGACIDTLTDDSNCGGCGLSCAVACSAGECVLPLASGASPEGIAVDSTSVYVTLGGSMGAVVSLPLGELERYRIAVGVDDGVNLGGQPASRAPHASGRRDVPRGGVGFLRAPFLTLAAC